MEETGFFKKITQGLSDMCYIWAKEMRSTFTDEGVLIFFILVPLFYPLLYSWIYNNEIVTDVPVAVIDMSHSKASRQFIREFDASQNTKVATYCNNLDEAKKLIGHHKVMGAIYIPADFQSDLNQSKQTTISVFCDMSIMLNYKALFQTASAVATNMNAGIQISQSMDYTQRDDEITTEPLKYEAVQIFNPTGGYGNFLIPAVLILILQQTLLLGIGLSAGTARENNRYQELVPISRHYNGIFRIVLGKSLCYFMIYAVMGAYITLCVPRFFHFTCLATGKALIGLMVPFILSTIFFGMAMSCLVRYRENVILLVAFTSVPFLFLSGISWPQSNIPGFWQGVSCLFPSTFGIRGFTRINGMGATLADIKPEYQALWLQTLLYFFLTCIVYRYQIISARRLAFNRAEHIRQLIKKARK